jgi:serine/threonine protein kinase
MQRESATLTLADAVFFLQQATGALQAAHNQGIIHQDVRPQNVFFRLDLQDPTHSDGFLSDFRAVTLRTATATASQNGRSTPLYMPPEQWNGTPEKAFDQRVLAVLIYHLLTQSQPFQGVSSQAIDRHVAIQPSARSPFNPQWPASIDTVLLKTLAKDPMERFSLLPHFAQAFEQASLWKGDLRSILTIMAQEAFNDPTSPLVLPGGRSIIVPLLAHAQTGQIIDISDQGKSSYDYRPRGKPVLALTLAPEQKTPEPPVNVEPARPIPPGAIWLPHEKSVEGATLLAGPLIPDTEVPGENSKTDPTRETVHPFLATIPISDTPPPTLFKPRQRSRKQALFALVTVLLVLAMSSAFIIPGQIATLHVQATATARTVFAEKQATSLVESNQTATADVLATITATASSPDPYGGTLVLSDPLSGPGSAFKWSTDNDAFDQCHFKEGTYHVSGSCLAYGTVSGTPLFYPKVAFEVQLVTGQNCGELWFDGETSQITSDYAHVTVCQNGEYQLHSSDDNGYMRQNVANEGIMHVGPDQSNIIAMVVDGHYLTLYINYVKIDSIAYTNTSGGYLALAGLNGSDVSEEVVYSNARLWAL